MASNETSQPQGVIHEPDGASDTSEQFGRSEDPPYEEPLNISLPIHWRGTYDTDRQYFNHIRDVAMRYDEFFLKTGTKFEDEIETFFVSKKIFGYAWEMAIEVRDKTSYGRRKFIAYYAIFMKNPEDLGRTLDRQIRTIMQRVALESGLPPKPFRYMFWADHPDEEPDDDM